MTGKFVIGTDVGGTCTDTVVVAAGEPVYIGKVLSTPPHYERGVLASIENAARSMGLSTAEVLAETRLFVHGSTVAENAVFTREGAKVGLITTRGFEDTLFITRGGYGRYSGLTEAELKHPVITDRPEPLIDFEQVQGVPERVDYKGEVLLTLDEDAARGAIDHLFDTLGVDALAVCLLWSTNNPVHEHRVRDIARERRPGAHVSLSSDVSPVPGEYERTATTVMNAYTGPTVERYLTELAVLLRDHAYHGSILIMQSYGGLLPAERAARFSVGMIEGGPAAGVIGAKARGALLRDDNIIAADMGGTTFKVGVIKDGLFEYAHEPRVGRYHYTIPKMDIASIGAGGGSIVSLDPRTGLPMVGPKSAGAEPGPACYGRGGAEPTLTDVLLLIGYMDPGVFLGGQMKLDADAARRAFTEKTAKPMGVPADEAADGIYRVAIAKSTDLIRKLTVEKGIDPREFALHAIGGTCPMMCGALGDELGVKRIVIPYTASVDASYGMVSADVVHEYSHSETVLLPVAADVINAIYEPLIETARRQLRGDGFTDAAIRLEFSIDLHFMRQIHEVTTPVPGGMPMDAAAMRRLAADFERLYEGKFGRGSHVAGAQMEMTLFRVTARGVVPRPEIEALPLGGSTSAHARIGRRPIFVPRLGTRIDSAIYDFERLGPGNVVPGPAVIHTPITTIVVQSDQSARMDPYRNIIIER